MDNYTRIQLVGQIKFAYGFKLKRKLNRPLPSSHQKLKINAVNIKLFLIKIVKKCIFFRFFLTLSKL